MRQFEYEISADYFQFYVQDESADGNLGDSWSEQAVAPLLAVAPGTVGVGTARNMKVPVVVEVLDAEPHLDLGSWDHVTECSLDVASGRELGWGDEHVRELEIPPSSRSCPIACASRPRASLTLGNA